eukprot:gene6494-10502_t
MGNDEITNLIIMNGSKFMRAGLSGDCAPSSPLSLYASGRSTGTVVSLGSDINSVACIDGLNCLSNAVFSNVSGNKITEYLGDLLNLESGIEFKNYSEKSHLEYAKEKLCYVALDPKIEEKKNISRVHDLSYVPFTLYNSTFQCTEPLFNPHLIGSTSMSIQEMIWNCITTKPGKLQKNLFKNIIIEGAGSMFPGFCDRLKFELQKLNSSSQNIKIIAPPERTFSNFIGASILTSFDTFESQWMSSIEYRENGCSFINQKCIASPKFEPSINVNLFEINSTIGNSKKAKNLNFHFE